MNKLAKWSKDISWNITIKYYAKNWTPRVNEVLQAVHEVSNIYDRYAIAAKKELPGQLAPSTVGHLPKEISRFTRFIILYGATVTINVTNVNHWRSPLIQGGLELPVEVTVTMENTEKNEITITKYRDLVTYSYREPVNGRFEDVPDTILKQLNDNESPSASESTWNRDWDRRNGRRIMCFCL